MEIVEEVVVQKVLRTLSSRFDSKVSFLEDRTYFDKLRKDELLGIFTTYEMRTKKENPNRKEASFKATKNKKWSKHKPKKNAFDGLDKEDIKFVR